MTDLSSLLRWRATGRARTPIQALLFAAALLTGCADSGGGTAAELPDAGAVVDAALDSTVPECTILDEGTARSCSCGVNTGRQVCFSGRYSACECVSTVDSGVTSGNLCAAGFYSGQFTGKYKPGAFGFGLIGSFFEVDIMGAATSGFPALSFTLEMSSSGAGGEFQTYEVKNGCMIGSATALGTNNPFVAKLDGALDCVTGKFDGTITGYYELVDIDDAKFQFTGPLSAQFENPQQRLKDGIWNVKEPPSLSGEPAGGGGGMWSAVWESAAPPPGEDPCAQLTLTGDGGVTASDGGVGGDI